MRKITFAGQVKNIEFAEAKKAPKTFLQPTRFANRANKKIRKTLISGAEKKINLWFEEGKPKEYVQQKIKEATERGTEKIKTLGKKINTPNYQNNISSSANNVSIPNSNPKITPKAKTPLLSPKTNSSSLGKAGLVGAGLLTAGAIGYTVYRKTRKDKGKKRGRYAK